MSKHLKWSVFACSLLAICASVSFYYFVSHSDMRGPASDGSSMAPARWSETGSSKASPYYGGQY